MATAYTIDFYQNLGKLFYAIAASDKVVRQEEQDKLKDIVKKDWMSSNLIEESFKKDAEASILNTFNWLENDKEYDAETCYNSFITFKKENEDLFTTKVNSLIIKTANAIAHAFSGINKQELILVTKLKLELNKIN